MLAQKPIYKTYEDFPAEELYTYAGIDCIATSELLKATFDQITETPAYLKTYKGKKSRNTVQSIYRSLLDVEMPAYDFITDMEINGIKYDVPLNRQFKDQMERDVSILEDKIQKKFSRVVDLNSGKDVADYLFGENKLVAPYQTKKGGYSTDGDTLLELAKLPEWEILGDLAKRNDINSTYNTFIRDYVEKFVKTDGRIHPNYNQHGTSSFRITGDNPNLTQLPRAKYGYNIRECFTVDKGNLFLALDFSSAEVKVLGALCKDPTLLRAIEQGLDFHSFSASQMRGIPYNEFVDILANGEDKIKKQYKQWRQEAKVLTFAILYGAAAQGVAFQMDITKDEAQRLMDLYFKTYPLIKEFIEDTHANAVDNLFVVTPFGQRKQEFGAKEVFKRTAVYNAAKRNAQNVLVQSTTSTLGLFCFTKLNEEIKKLGGRVLCTVYDSIEIEIPVNRAAEAIEKAFYYMNDYPVETFDWLELPIGVEAELGHNWGNAGGIHRGVTQEEINFKFAA